MKNNNEVRYNSLEKNRYIDIESITNQQIQFSMNFFATIYVVIMAPNVVNASKNGNTAFVYFSRTFPEIIANINTKLITYTCLIFFHFLILITHPSFDTLFH